MMLDAPVMNTTALYAIYATPAGAVGEGSEQPGASANDGLQFRTMPAVLVVDGRPQPQLRLSRDFQLTDDAGSQVARDGDLLPTDYRHPQKSEMARPWMWGFLLFFSIMILVSMVGMASELLYTRFHGDAGGEV